ncbi:MAG: hypothetical protein N3G74_02360 [Candidatus Micrarchaeota archaeon]|nr:hypothetical protein [Candidatus Micrarchaeota archaeon]
MESISEYKNNPDLLIRKKMLKLMHLESKLHLDFDRIKTPSDLFKEATRQEKKRDDLGISLFRDIISMDFAKTISMNTRIELKIAFRLVKASIDMGTARKLFETEAVRFKDAILFQLNEDTKTEIVNFYLKQIKEGNMKLRLPKRFYGENE